MYSPLIIIFLVAQISQALLFGKPSARLVCPQSTVIVQKPNYVFKTNGCGPQKQWYSRITNRIIQRFHPTLIECCDKHDICYQTCGQIRKKCDTAFRDCVYKKCKVIKKWRWFRRLRCKAYAKFMYRAVSKFGKYFFHPNTIDRCMCVKKKKRSK